jgi:hypothetical protein
MSGLKATCCLILIINTSLSCAPIAPRASLGDFTDEVLEPLALRVADEKISEVSAERKFARTPKATIQTLAMLLQDIPWIGKLVTFDTVSRKAQLEEDLAWLDTRRIPLKRELLNLFVLRTKQDGEVFSFCISGVQRRYQAIEAARFTRLADGLDSCEQTQLMSLKPES